VLGSVGFGVGCWWIRKAADDDVGCEVRVSKMVNPPWCHFLLPFGNFMVPLSSSNHFLLIFWEFNGRDAVITL